MSLRNLSKKTGMTALHVAAYYGEEGDQIFLTSFIDDISTIQKSTIFNGLQYKYSVVVLVDVYNVIKNTFKNIEDMLIWSIETVEYHSHAFILFFPCAEKAFFQLLCAFREKRNTSQFWQGHP